MLTRRTLIASTTAAALAGVAACAPSPGASSPAGGGGSAAPEGGGKVTLNVWSWRVEDTQAYNEIFKVFTDKNPSIGVNFQPYKNTEYNQILATGLKGSQGPDIAQLKSYGGLESLVESQSLLPLDPAKITGLDKFAEPARAGMTARDKKIYGVPFAIQTLQMFYNKKLFESKGYQVPTTWEAFIALCQKIKADGLIPVSLGGGEAQVQVPVATEIFTSSRYGGDTFLQAVNKGSKTFTAPEYVAALELMKEVQPYLPPNVVSTTADDGRILFLSEKAVMLPALTAELAYLLSQKKDLAIGSFNVPTGPNWASNKTLTPGFVDGGWGISAKSDKVEAATKLLTWMASAEFGQLFSDKLNQISPVPGVSIKDPLLKEMAGRYESSPSPYLMLVGFRYGQPWGTDLVGKGVQALWLGQKSAAQVAQDIQTGLAAWFKPQS